MKSLFVPLSIVCAGALIAGGIVVGGRGASDSTGSTSRGEDAYVLGKSDAPIRIVEFSDFECPFCARLHPTLAKILEDFPEQVSWEYRHLPLPNHRNAEQAAIAGECIGRLKGNDAFWDYAQAAFDNQRNLGTPFYEQEAERLGIDLGSFRTCVADPTVSEVVRIDYQDGIKNGGNGTPFVVIMYADGSTKTFAGALPYAQIKSLITGQ